MTMARIGTFDPSLEKYIYRAQEYYRDEYGGSLNDFKQNQITKKIKNFDHLKSVYEIGFEKAQEQSGIAKQHFYQEMRATEARVQRYRDIVLSGGL